MSDSDRTKEGFTHSAASHDEQTMGPNEKVMSLGEHLGELRVRFMKAFVSILVIFFVAMGFATPILDFLKEPLIKALPKTANALHFTSPLEPFIAQLKVSFLVSIVCGCPIWLFQFWRFVEPALYPKEKKYILPFTVISVLLFATGVGFCFFFMLPMALEFLIGLGLESAQAIITISDYVSVLLILVIAFGVVFETPLVLVLLAMLDLISVESLTKNRRFVVVAIVFLSAILTPPDPISQIAMAIPTYAMYEISIIIIRFIKRPSKKETGASNDDPGRDAQDGDH